MSKAINDCLAICQKYIDIEWEVQTNKELSNRDRIYSMGRRHMAEEIHMVIKQMKEISDKRD